eukprot:TRINITY_DN93461_c0_g1_i1.p1 TRINITY_DN93461_c0_g1~~TRINITY_DN93461_c0_g1_i1.p1  ORF type:complete len:354 (+),score=77.15 TRINITY_DN93461_c0_g1_i1:39-1064(+)
MKLLGAALAAACLQWPSCGEPPRLLSLAASYELRQGRQIPVLGLGASRALPGTETEDAVRWALDMGYRMIDTAASAENEASVGKAMRDSGVARGEIFLTTKLNSTDHGFDSTHLALRRSLGQLRVDYVDLYLIQSPVAGKLIETWDAVVELRKMGLARAVGVSNFGLAHLEALETHGRELPEVNQVELHPLNWKERQPLLEWCRQRGILVQAYGSLFGSQPELLEQESLIGLAGAKAKTPGQVLLRWGLQMGFQLIPKSGKRERIKENSEIFDFELSAEELAELQALPGKLSGRSLAAPVHLGDMSKGNRYKELVEPNPVVDPLDEETDQLEQEREMRTEL